MYLTKITINNFRGIEHREIDFRPGFNLLIGENGRGKTSILEAISVGLGGFISGIEGVIIRHFAQEEIRTVFTPTGSASYNMKHIVPIEVACCAQLSGRAYEWKRTRTDFSSSRTTIQPKSIAKAATALATDDMSVLPVICYQSAARAWMQRRDTSQSSSALPFYRAAGYSSCLADVASRKQILNWCAKMEQTAWQNDQSVDEYEGVKAAVAGFMSIMEDGIPCSVSYDKRSENLLYSREDTISSFATLSAGYQTLIWMIFDIAYRMAVLNPNLKREICKTPGIVLIDELDIHLHPAWQWRVIGALRTIFPEVQFIVTTHSSILLASMQQGHIINIEDPVIATYSSSGFGLDINDTLIQVQNSQDRPTRLTELQRIFYQAIDKEAIDKALEILLDVEREIGQDQPFSVELRTTYELEAALIKER